MAASPLGDKAFGTNNEMHKLDHMTTALQALCQGLANLSRGLRATYIRINQLGSTMRQLEHRGGGLLGG
jgi:hypothetical protein